MFLVVILNSKKKFSIDAECVRRNARLRSKKFKTDKPEHKDGQRSGDNARGHKPTGKNRRHTGNSSSSNPYANSPGKPSGNSGGGRRINPSPAK